MSRFPPTGRYTPSSTTRNSSACTARCIRWKSSSSSVPPRASVKNPSCRPTAPVNAPASCPKNWLAANAGTTSRAVTRTNAPLRPPSSCSARANSDLPVPVAPIRTTGARAGAYCRTRSTTSSIAPDVATTEASTPFRTTEVATRESGASPRVVSSLCFAVAETSLEGTRMNALCGEVRSSSGQEMCREGS